MVLKTPEQLAEEAQAKKELEDKATAEKAAADKAAKDKAEKDKGFDPEAFKAEMETRFKKEIDGLNRRNSELEKKIQDEQKAKMTEKEKADYDLKAARDEADKARREAQEFQLERIRFKALVDAGLDPKDATLIGGASEEEIIERVKHLKDRVESLAEARVDAEVKKRFDAAGRPGGGDNPGGTLTYTDILKMPDEQIAKLPSGVLDAAISAAQEK